MFWITPKMGKKQKQKFRMYINTYIIYILPLHWFYAYKWASFRCWLFIFGSAVAQFGIACRSTLFVWYLVLICIHTHIHSNHKCSYTRSLARSLVRWFVRLFIRLIVRSFDRSFFFLFVFCHSLLFKAHAIRRKKQNNPKKQNQNIYDNTKI